MRKATRRKVYQLVDPIKHATEGAAFTCGKELEHLRIDELSALRAMCSGTAKLYDWERLASMVNICETMAKGGIGHEALPHCQQAERELLASAKRYEETKRMGLTAAGINALREVYAYHDLQRISISRGEYDRWIRKTVNLLKSKAPGVVDVAEVV